MGNRSAGNASPSSASSEFEDLLFEARNGNERAFTMIWKNLNPRLTRYVATQSYGSGIDYEDVVSETWISVAKDISKFKGEYSNFKSWLYSIARNRIVDAVRKNGRQIKSYGEPSEMQIVDLKTSVLGEIESDEGLKSIIQAIQTLPPAQAEAIMLRIVAELEINEVAKILDKSEGTVRVACHRGLETLRNKLKEDQSGR